MKEDNKDNMSDGGAKFSQLVNSGTRTNDFNMKFVSDTGTPVINFIERGNTLFTSVSTVHLAGHTIVSHTTKIKH